ncbi:hypothetical protein GBA52_008038 [Prunus armeniaca]|nr:hypothetical protein GBA52_008038 [Prunus armeniaca]
MLTNEQYNGLFALMHSDITLRFFSEKPKQLHRREVRERGLTAPLQLMDKVRIEEVRSTTKKNRIATHTHIKGLGLENKTKWKGIKDEMREHSVPGSRKKGQSFCFFFSLPSLSLCLKFQFLGGQVKALRLWAKPTGKTSQRTLIILYTKGISRGPSKQPPAGLMTRGKPEIQANLIQLGRVTRADCQEKSSLQLYRHQFLFFFPFNKNENNKSKVQLVSYKGFASYWTFLKA